MDVDSSGHSAWPSSQTNSKYFLLHCVPCLLCCTTSPSGVIPRYNAVAAESAAHPGIDVDQCQSTRMVKIALPGRGMAEHLRDTPGPF